jgi:hypothetical protein
VKNYPHKKFSAIELVANSWRPDLIAKFSAAKSYMLTGEFSEYSLDAYRRVNFHLNYFFEESPPKKGVVDFESSFASTIESISQNGYNENSDPVEISASFRVISAAHRVSASAAMGLEVPVLEKTQEEEFDFQYLVNRGMPIQILDQLALINLNLDRSARVFILHGILTTLQKAEFIESISNSLRVLYIANRSVSLNGYINLKRINYENASRSFPINWIGTPFSDWDGLRLHAESSIGEGELTLVFVQGSSTDIVEKKNELRNLTSHGNFGIHTSETWQETFAIGASMLHQESFEASEIRPFNSFTKLDEFSNLIQKLTAVKPNLLDQLLLGGSSALDANGIRKANDIDLLQYPLGFNAGLFDVHVGHHQQVDYPIDFKQISLDPTSHFFFRGLKICSLEILEQSKRQGPRDFKNLSDLDLITRFRDQKEFVQIPPRSNGVKSIFKRVFLDSLYWFSIRFKFFYRIWLFFAIRLFKMRDKFFSWL